MIPVKIECACGQRFAFDVEPVNGRMPTSVVCPACGVDGTNSANAIIAQALAAQPTAAPMRIPTPAPAPVVFRPESPAPAAAAGLRLNVPAASGPPPIPPQAATPRGRMAAPVAKRPKAGKDGWATEETGLNKLGTYITVLPPIMAAMLPWGIMGVDLPVLPVCIVMAVCGSIGGAINVLGRGPWLAGAAIGLCIAVGGYGATVLWIHDRKSVYKIELLIAFAIGAAPGMGLQFLLQYILRKRAKAAE